MIDFVSVRPRAWPTILGGGAIAGLLDIADAVVVTIVAGNSPIRMLQYIASGVLGRTAAFEGGLGTAALGLLLHFFIALTAASVYVGAARLLKFPIRHPVVSGMIFGVCVYVVMNIVVLPLAGFPGLFDRLPPWPYLVNGVAIHAFGVGLPIALVASRSAR